MRDKKHEHTQRKKHDQLKDRREDLSCVIIRQVTVEDAFLLAELGARTFYEAFSSKTPSKDMATYLHESFAFEKVHAEISDKDATFFTAEITGSEHIGYAKLCCTVKPPSIDISKAIQLERFYLLRHWWGSGVADLLMERCLEESLNCGFQAVWLSSWEENVRAQKFYQKWHFKRVGEAVFTIGKDIQKDEILLRRLS